MSPVLKAHCVPERCLDTARDTFLEDSHCSSCFLLLTFKF